MKAAPEGRWVLRQGVRIWQGHRPADAHTCLDCDAELDHGNQQRCTEHAAARDAQRRAAARVRYRARKKKTAKPTGTPTRLCACGCLVARGEDCPACRVWAYENECAWNRGAA